MSRPAARPHRFQVPSRRDVLKWAEDLAAQLVTREQAAEWAIEYVLFDEPEVYPGVDDTVVWKAITMLAGADTRTAPDTYLHGVEDFRAWVDEIKAMIGLSGTPDDDGKGNLATD